MPQTDAKVLLVEDDPELATALAVKFAHSSYELIHAATGSAGLELVQTEQPDLVILDLMLPDIPGEQVLEHVREQSSLPVVIISAKCEEHDKILGLQNGADDYVTKPLSPRELVARVDAVLRRSRVVKQSSEPHPSGWPHSILRGAGIELNLQSREVQVDDREIEVTPTEFGLLRALVERAGAALSIDHLLKNVWGYDGYDRHIVEAHMCRLRAKIEAKPSDPSRIVTVRGFGYRLNVATR